MNEPCFFGAKPHRATAELGTRGDSGRNGIWIMSGRLTHWRHGAIALEHRSRRPIRYRGSGGTLNGPQ